MGNNSENSNFNKVNFGEALIGKRRVINSKETSLKQSLLMIFIGLLAIPTLGLFTALAEKAITGGVNPEKPTREKTLNVEDEGKTDPLFQNLIQFLNEATNKVETVKLLEGEKDNDNESHRATCYLAYNTKLKAWERDPDLKKYVEKAESLGLSEKNCFRILTDKARTLED